MAKNNDLFAPPTEDELADNEADLFGAPSEKELAALEGPSMLESIGRGATQGATIGFADEIGAAVLTPVEKLRQKIASLISGTPENVDAELRAQGFTGDIEEKGMVDTYADLRDATREANTASQDENPWAYGTADVVGGIAPGLVSGGGATAANLTKSLGKAALKEGAEISTKEAAKQAAKLGAKYGTVAGAGYSEADNLKDLAIDTGIGTAAGGTLGAALPVALKGAKTGLKGLSNKAKQLMEALPGSDTAKLSYKYGKEGKKVAQEALDEDVMKTARTVLKKIQADKEANSVVGMRETLSNAGVKINADSEISGAIDDLQKIATGNHLGATDKTILAKMEALAGKNAQAEKMAARAQKQAIKKSIESEGKEAQAIIKGEKDLAKQAIKSGDDLQTITDINRPMDQLDLPLNTSEGRISGVAGKFKNVDGDEYVTKQLSDTTPYQPELTKSIGPDGRPIVKTLDKGSGKITALVGDMDDQLNKLDLENMTLVEGKQLLDQINVITDIAKNQGTAKDPAIKRLMGLAGKLRGLEKDAIKKHGNAALNDRTARFSDIFTAEELLGIKDKMSPRADVDTVKKTIEIGNRFGFEKGFGSRQEGKLAEELLGDKVMTPAVKERLDFLQKLNALTGRTSVDDNVSKAGIFKKMVTDIPNVAGRAVKSATDTLKPITSPVKNVTDTLGLMTQVQVEQFANKLTSSTNKGHNYFGKQLTNAAAQEGAAKSQAVWALSQSAAFREMLKREVPALEADTREELGMEQVVEEESEPSREPASIDGNSNLKEKEGYAGLLKKTTKYNGLTGPKNSRVEGSSDYGLYYDSKGNLTSGYGDLITSEEEAQSKMNQTIEDAESSLTENVDDHNKDADTVMSEMGIDKSKLSDDQIKAIQDMVFQLGMGTALEFKETLGHVAKGNYEKASELVKKSNWNKQTPKRVQDFSDRIVKSKLGGILAGYADQELPLEDGGIAQEELAAVDTEIDRVNQQQSSGDQIPMSQLDSLLEKINNLRASEEQIDDLEEDAIKMESYSDGARLKEKIRKLQE